MSEFLTTFLGAVVGGIFALLGGWLQGKHQLTALASQFENERLLAAEAHERDQVAVENDRIREQLDAQAIYGRKLMQAAVMFQTSCKQENPKGEYAEVCTAAMRRAGLSRDDPSPYPTFMQGEEIEDEQLRAMVTKHRDEIGMVDFALGICDPSQLPADCTKTYKEVDALARRIGVRWRLLQRQGKPI